MGIFNLMKCYLFDIDGTLTEPRKQVKQEFAKKFSAWALGKNVFLATGSDYPKVLEQLPQDFLDLFQGIFCCMGNELRDSSGKILEKSKFVIPDVLNDDLARILTNSPYEPKLGRHIEFRTGMVNFSVVGRRANMKERGIYSKWDSVFGERKKIAAYINRSYPNLEASVGGSISIDIIEKGKDKGQVVHWLIKNGFDNIEFFGDRCFPGGNDWGIVRELEKSNIVHEYHNVESPNEVIEILNI